MISIDTWPVLGSHIEIEADNHDSIVKWAKRMGFKEEDISYTDIENLYKEKGINLKTTKNLTFQQD